MKKTAKLISAILTFLMAALVLFSVATNAIAASAPEFSVTKVSSTSNTVTVQVNLVSGKFNAFDFNFVMSDGVKCTSIKYGAVYADLAINHQAIGSMNPEATVSSGFANVSLASTVACDKKGAIIVATFSVPAKKSYSIGIKVSSCNVTNEKGVNEAVTPKVSSSVSYTEPTTTTTKKPTTTTTTTKKPNTTTTKGSTTTTKKGTIGTTINTTIIPTKKGSITTTTSKNSETGGVVAGTLPSGPDSSSSTDVSNLEPTSDIAEITDDNLDLDEYNSEGNTLAVNAPTEKESASLDNLFTDSHNKKTIIIVAAAAAVVVLGAVIALVVINKKKKEMM